MLSIIFLLLILIFVIIIFATYILNNNRVLIPCEINRQCKNKICSINTDDVCIFKQNKWIKCKQDIIFDDDKPEVEDYFYKSQRLIPRKIYLKENELYCDSVLLYTFDKEEQVNNISVNQGCLGVITKYKLQNRLYFVENYMKNKLKRIQGNFPKMKMKVYDKQLFIHFHSLCI